ncbi:MAG: hypothetical protein ACK6D1_11390 [Planctomycetota bacterium]|jgi:hypothetical protein
MKVVRQILAACLFLAVLALPGIGGDGGPNGGGTGVWVLPAASYLTANAPTLVRDAHASVSVSQPLRLKVSDEVGDAIAVFADDLSSAPISLPVVNREVTVPAALLTAMSQRIGSQAVVVIADASLRGYIVKIAIAADRTAVVRVF